MPVNVQPYEPPKTNCTPEGNEIRVFRISQRMWLVAYLYPMAMMGSLYAIWLLAWWELGHMPRPNIDDPKSIGGMTSLFYYLPLLVAMPFPIMIPLGLVSLFYLKLGGGDQSKARWWWLLPAVYLLFCVLTYWTLRWDPWRVAEWYAD